MLHSEVSTKESEFLTPEQAHLLRKLQDLLATRNHDVRLGRHGGPETSVVQENRRLIRDCITKLRHLRAAGGSSPWLGLGQREARRVG